jgi:transcription antitermination factor NusG
MIRIDPSRYWYVVRANIKCESKAAENIKNAGFDVYLPRQRYEVKNRRTNTYSVRERPLMMRYLFVGLKPDALHFGFVRSCEGVERFLEVEGRPLRVGHKDVDAILSAEVDMVFDDTREARIHRKEEARTRKETVRMKFKEGSPVLVTEGVFANFSGVVEAVTKSGNVEALVSIFGRLVTATFDPQQLQPAA